MLALSLVVLLFNAEEKKGLLSDDRRERLETKNELILSSKNGVKDAIQVLKRKYPPGSAGFGDPRLPALEVIRYFRAKEAVSTLIEIIDLRLAQIEGRGNDKFYPVAITLVAIGKPSVEGVLGSLEQGMISSVPKDRKVRLDRLLWVLEEIEGKDGAVIALRKRIASSKVEKWRENLLAALKIIESTRKK